jgi:hypothetical protein
LPLAVRYRKLFEIKGEPPRPRLVYYARHGGPFWWALYPWVYARPLFATLQRLWTQPRPSALPRRK